MITVRAGHRRRAVQDRQWVAKKAAAYGYEDNNDDVTVMAKCDMKQDEGGARWGR